MTYIYLVQITSSTSATMRGEPLCVSNIEDYAAEHESSTHLPSRLRQSSSSWVLLRWWASECQCISSWKSLGLVHEALVCREFELCSPWFTISICTNTCRYIYVFDRSVPGIKFIICGFYQPLYYRCALVVKIYLSHKCLCIMKVTLLGIVWHGQW